MILARLTGLFTVAALGAATAICDEPYRNPLCQYVGFVRGGPTQGGEAVQIDLPVTEHLKNKGGSDGSGLCVFTSIDHAARWPNEPALIGFRDFMTRHPGGGWPEKVDKFIPLMAQSKGLPAPKYLQHTGGDAEFLKRALKTGRYPAVTYAGRDGVYYPMSIAHMVNLAHFSDQWAAIQDNNNPGEWLWMKPDQFLSRWREKGGGWALVLMKPGPPPIPTHTMIRTRSDSFVTDICPSYRTPVGQPDTRHPGPPRKGDAGIKEDGVPLPVDYPRPAKVDPKIKDHGLSPAPSLPDTGLKPLPELPKKDPDTTPPLRVGNFGVEVDKIQPKESYHLNGRDVTKEEAFRALESAVVDDSTLPWLTVNLADPEIRKRVLGDLESHPSLAPWKNKILVQDYSPDHWAVAGVGHRPGLIFQSPRGTDGRAKVLFRIEQYQGPEALAGALRKADPNYDPAKDPDPTRPNPRPNSQPGPNGPNDPLNPNGGFDPRNLPTWVWVIGACALFWFFTKKGTDK